MVNVMYVIKPDRISVFRNGILVGEAATTVKISDLGTSLKSYFGKSFYGDNGLFNGSFDNIEIYNRALTDAEILERYPQTGSNSVLQKAAIQGGKVIREEFDEANHTVTQYVSVNNSTIKNLKSVAVDFTVLSGYTISGLKGTYNLLDGAKVTITSKTDAADSAVWTIRAVPCNNPVLGGLYADPDIDVFDGKYYIYQTTDGYTGWNNGRYHFTWSCNDTGEDTYSISYAVADSLYPQKNADNSWGDFTVESRGTILYKVPEEDILGTGHHCFVKLPGTEEYYIAYARFGTPLSDYVGDKNVKGCHREVCLEKVSFDDDGHIERITPTHRGIQEAVTANVQVVYQAAAGGKVQAGNGTAQTEITSYIPYKGMGTVVTAVPDTGKAFDQWSDGVKTASRTDIGEKDTSVATYFKNDEHRHVHTYADSVQPATAAADGKIVSKCACGDVKSTTIIPRIKEVKLSAETFTFNNKTKLPAVTVYDRNSQKISAAFYSVTASAGRKKIGTYQVTVAFKGNYSGTVTRKFRIVPAGVKLTKVSAAKKGFTAKWKRKSGLSGYELQYSTNRKFAKAKVRKITKAKTTSKKVTKLKAKKKYYVRVRTYKMVGKTKYVSSWSKSKMVKTK